MSTAVVFIGCIAGGAFALYGISSRILELADIFGAAYVTGARAKVIRFDEDATWGYRNWVVMLTPHGEAVAEMDPYYAESLRVGTLLEVSYRVGSYTGQPRRLMILGVEVRSGR